MEKQYKKTMVSGLQPTNNLTLGNYLGAIRNFVKYQDQYNMYIFVADLHAITTNTKVDLKKNKIEIAKIYLASGIDHNKVVIFNQSDVQEHTMLGYILTCNTTIGELSRMTQFKDKSSKSKAKNGTDFIPTGLLIYPGLMAADILLYDSEIVIVGQDQKQHIELTRNIAQRFNNLYNRDFFKIPEFKTEENSAKIMDLVNPTIKMSKSNENTKGTIFLLEDVQLTRKKIMSALTDNFNKVKYDIENQPGISNLINIYSCFTNKSIEEIENQFSNIQNYGEFKKEVADVVCSHLLDLQDKFNKITDNQINEILINGAKKAKEVASKKVSELFKIMNF